MISRRKIIERHEQSGGALAPQVSSSAAASKSAASKQNEAVQVRKKQVSRATESTDSSADLVATIRHRLRAEMREAGRARAHSPAAGAVRRHKGRLRGVPCETTTEAEEVVAEEEEEGDGRCGRGEELEDEECNTIADEEDEPKLTTSVGNGLHRKWFDPYSVYGDDDDDCDEDVWYSDERLFEVSSLSRG